MAQILVAIVCGLCGARFDNSKDVIERAQCHWKRHSAWDRFRYRFRYWWRSLNSAIWAVTSPKGNFHLRRVCQNPPAMPAAEMLKTKDEGKLD
jgi:hypothetical protein